jgi:hypothetical protein
VHIFYEKVQLWKKIILFGLVLHKGCSFECQTLKSVKQLFCSLSMVCFVKSLFEESDNIFAEMLVPVFPLLDETNHKSLYLWGAFILLKIHVLLFIFIFGYKAKILNWFKIFLKFMSL